MSGRHRSCATVVRRGFALALVLMLAAAASAAGNGGRGARWVATWATSPQVLGPLGTGVPGAAGLENQTVREIVHTSAGGRAVRLRLTNRLGDAPVTFDAVRIGLRAAGPALAPGSDRPVTFGGRTHVTIADHAEVVSDSVALPVAPDSDVAISLFVAAPTGPPTAHALALQTNYIAPGDATVDGGGGAFTTTFGSWYFVSELDVLGGPRVGSSIVALGDSITDGAGTTPDTNRRWPDQLARLLGGRVGLANGGIIGNNVHESSLCFGLNAIARLETEVFSRAGVRDVVFLEGINDITHPDTPEPRFPCLTRIPISAEGLIEQYELLIVRVHAEGLRIYGGTLTPSTGWPSFTPAMEVKRQQVNEWIRTSGAFDAYIDFDAVLRDPADLGRLAPPYDSGDHLHPSDAGAFVMARAAYRVLRGAAVGRLTRHARRR
jgi:lysophospholipase L1-like esterase